MNLNKQFSSLKQELEQTINADSWAKVGVYPHHGIQTPLSALHSADSCGIGEFLDLIPLIDWCRSLGFDFLQLLPLNNSPLHPSPYLCESSCALNPIYLSLHKLPYLSEFPKLYEMIKEMRKLTVLERVDFHQTGTAKMCFLKEYYNLIQEREAERIRMFCEAQPWVKCYALFKSLQESHRYLPWRQWPAPLQSPKEEELDNLYSLYECDANFYVFLQALCFEQMSQVKTYATKKGLFLMGDLPILLSQESVDNWQYVEYFNPHLGAGAPPDVYNAEGQNWNLPLFNWDAMKKQDFSWWKVRLKYAENFYDLFRIDHILGFFHFYAIPFNHPSSEGFYIPEADATCAMQGEELLKTLCALTNMLPIGEDLGQVPPYVEPCLKKLGICGTRVIRWERRWKGDKGYIPLSTYTPLSITSIGTHDSAPLSLWWKLFEEDATPLAALKGWTYQPTLSFEQREEILKDSHHSNSLFHGNLLQEYLALFPDLIHKTPEEERINIPGKDLPENWSYRYVCPIEQIVQHEGLEKAIKGILS